LDVSLLISLSWPSSALNVKSGLALLEEKFRTVPLALISRIVRSCTNLLKVNLMMLRRE
jgi:hypothetical protein